ncbi:MAG: hypothetical protein EBU21_17355, partial [Proteobacteria bacterium]|nr:hypothetical protein [Pseudomonadota bacterium]
LSYAQTTTVPANDTAAGALTYTTSKSVRSKGAQFWGTTATLQAVSGIGSITTTTLTVATLSTGTLAIGHTITGPNIQPGTVITAFGTGTGGTGTYTISPSQTAASSSIAAAPSTFLTVTSVTSGTLATGQVLSGGISTSPAPKITTLGTGTGGTGTYVIDTDPTVSTSTLITSTNTDYIVVKAVTTEARGLASPPALSLTGALTKDMTPVSAYSVTACPCTNYYYASTAGAKSASFTGRIDNGTSGQPGTTLTVTSVVSGSQLYVGQMISRSGVLPGTTITAFAPGTSGGAGSYTVSQSQTVGTTSSPATITADMNVGVKVVAPDLAGNPATATGGGASV